MILLRIRTVLLLTLIGLVYTTTCFGQTATVSPYSRYGVGDLQNQDGVQGFSMGGTGTAIHNDTLTPYFINLKNPASYFYDRVTVFEAGLLNNNVTLSTEGQTHHNNNAYFGYFAIAFPIGNHVGASFGLRPMSSVGYSIDSTGTIDSSGTSIGSTTNQYVGTGGINQVHVGLAISPGKKHNFSAGANVSYLFGNLNYTDNVVYSPNLLAFNSQRTENVDLHGFALDYGLMYTGNISNKWQLILGATASFGAKLYGNYNLLSLSYVPNAPQSNIDTVQNESASGRIQLPVSYGGGITFIKRDKYNNNQWMFSMDYAMQNWSQYKYFGQTQSNLTDSRQGNIGIQYIPRKNADQSHTYFQRIHYRMGFSYNQTYLDLNNTQLNDYAISFGIGTNIGPNSPMLRASILNIGVQFGQMGTTSNDLLKEQYVKILFGFTFNDRWFIKHQYE